MADDSQYTRTGNGGLTKFANQISMWIPIAGGWLAWPIGMLDTVIESAGWLLRGKFLSAATSFAGGFVGNTVNSATAMAGSIGGSSILWWIGNAGSGIATGQSLGTQARALTESTIGMITQPLGMKPTVLRAYPAGPGYLGGNDQPGPGQFMSDEARRRGVDPQAYYNQKMNGEMSQHMEQLQSARAQPGYNGIQ